MKKYFLISKQNFFENYAYPFLQENQGNSITGVKFLYFSSTKDPMKLFFH